MIKKKIIFLLIGMVFSINFYSPVAFADETSIREQIEKNNILIQEIENSKNEILSNIEIETNDLNELNELITSKESVISEIQSKISEMQYAIDQINSDINIKEENIILQESKISEIEEEIDSLELEENEIRQMFDNRLVMYYKGDIANRYLVILLKSKSLNEFFSTLDGVIKVMNADRILMQTLKDTINLIATKKNESEIARDKLILEKQEIELIANDLIEKQNSIIDEKVKEQQELSYLASLEEAKNTLLVSLGEKKNELDVQLESLTSFNSDLQAELDSLMSDVNIGNDEPIEGSDEYFLRPTPGYVTCEFGPRQDPISGEAGYHTGVDFGDNYGVSIKATKGGYVQHAGWINGYGNAVIINHGDGVQSLYAHAESLNVSVGQYVSQGEVIAFVGSTGWSTGPHLHFEIRFDGVPVNPLNYV